MSEGDDNPDALPNTIAWFDAPTQVRSGGTYLLIGKRNTGKTNAVKHLISALSVKAKSHLLAVATKSQTKKQDDGCRAFTQDYDHDQALRFARYAPGTSLIVLDDVFVDASQIKDCLMPLIEEVRRHDQTLIVAVSSLSGWKPMHFNEVDVIFQASQIHGTTDLYSRFYSLVWQTQEGFELWLDAVTDGGSGYYFMVVDEDGEVMCYRAPRMRLHLD